MDKKAKIATITALVIAVSLVALVVYAAPKQCNNGSDDDNDGLVDYPNDPGCSSSADNTETGTAICDNGLDETHDADTLADFRLSGGDPGCSSVTDANERDGPCDDTFDNDMDGFVDYPSDPECNSFADVEDDCTDTDGGQVYTVQGTTSGTFGGVPFSDTDFCVDSINLKEFYCFNKSLNTTVGCNNQTLGTTSCVNGACV